MLLTIKEKGKVSTEIVSAKKANKISSMATKTKTHLCWDRCPIGQCNSYNCPKIFDVEKKSIEEYDFIISGIESRDKLGELKSFIVQECALLNKYEMEHPIETEEDKVKELVK